MTANDPEAFDQELIDVKSVGVRWFHQAGFCVDRPDGIGEYTFIQWLTPSVLRIAGDARIERSGGCIVYRPGDPQWYGADSFTPFGNNWFHFNGRHVERFLTKYGIPLNTPFYLRDDSFIETILQTLLWESMGERLGWKVVSSSHAALFFVEAARVLIAESPRRHSARNIEMQRKFEDFRERLKTRCAEPWTLSLMASELHLSVSQFSKLYRQFFGAKPVDDLIGMRISMAEYYLRTTSMPITFVANMAGFTDIYYFSRVFKAKTGRTATKYRALHYTGET